MTMPDPGSRSIGGVDRKNDIFGRYVPARENYQLPQVRPHCSLIQASACLCGALGLHAIMIKNQNKNTNYSNFTG
jgi:hypothetical protein